MEFPYESKRMEQCSSSWKGLLQAMGFLGCPNIGGKDALLRNVRTISVLCSSQCRYGLNGMEFSLRTSRSWYQAAFPNESIKVISHLWFLSGIKYLYFCILLHFLIYWNMLHNVHCCFVVVRCLFGVGCGRPYETLKTEPASQEFAQIYDIYVGGKGQIDALLGCHCQSVIWNPYYLVQQS